MKMEYNNGYKEQLNLEKLKSLIALTLNSSLHFAQKIYFEEVIVLSLQYKFYDIFLLKS